MRVSAVLRRGTGRFFHWCPACESLHPLPDHGWTFNRDVDRPSFAPSFAQGYVDAFGNERRCHYIITDGLIQFCPDSWHGRSDIVAMPPIPQSVIDAFPIETQD